MSPRQYAKALVGCAVAGLSALLPVMEDGLTGTEVLTAVVAALVALGAVFAVPNQAPPGHPADPDLSEQSGVDDGHIEPVGLALVVLFVLLLLVLFGVISPLR